MLRQSERGIEYPSEQYGERVFGYSEVNRKTLAQTSEIALVTIAIGSSVNINGNTTNITTGMCLITLCKAVRLLIKQQVMRSSTPENVMKHTQH
jgi:hypothetical protein